MRGYTFENITLKIRNCILLYNFGNEIKIIENLRVINVMYYSAWKNKKKILEQSIKGELCIILRCMDNLDHINYARVSNNFFKYESIVKTQLRDRKMISPDNEDAGGACDVLKMNNNNILYYLQLITFNNLGYNVKYVPFTHHQGRYWTRRSAPAFRRLASGDGV